MKIYLPGGNTRTQTVYVQPGNEFPNSNFCDAQGNAILMAVKFEHGLARVPGALGEYMVDKGFAQRSPLVIVETKLERAA